MHYPFWYVPGLTSPMLIAFIAVLHVLVSSYAVGGGLFLAMEVRYAHRTGNKEYLAYLKHHTWFFVLLTVAYGAITGVGIWWTIGLASPLPTEFLIHTFVFGWAMEYVFFVIEIVAAFIFYYAWDRLKPRVHEQIGWIYGLSAWISLVIITAVTSFMLNPGNWQNNFWLAVLNPQTFPQILARTGASLLLATLYVFLHSSFRANSASVRTLIAQRSSRPAMLGAVLILLGGLGWLLTLPESARAALTGAAALNIMAVMIFLLTVIVLFMFYYGPYKNPSWVSPGFAIVLFVLGLIVTAEGEFVREAVRKPFVIYNEVYSHNVLKNEVPTLQLTGFLNGGIWTKHYITRRFPEIKTADGRIDNARLATLPHDSQVEVGHTIFQYHCGSCHASSGYSGMKEMLRGWDAPMLEKLILNLDRYHYFMPPWSGTPEEAKMLTRYLETLTSPHPIQSAEGRPSRGKFSASAR
jgi:cytochrome d ubiquinol oxidase subunit I